jgi:hypothetical protein
MQRRGPYATRSLVGGHMSPRQYPWGSNFGSSMAAVGTGNPDHHRRGAVQELVATKA